MQPPAYILKKIQRGFETMRWKKAIISFCIAVLVLSACSSPGGH